MIALSGWWTVGWLAGAAVVVAVAILLLVIIGVARKITTETREITAGLDGVGGKTGSLKDLTRTHRAVIEITNGLRRARGQGAYLETYRSGGLGPGMRTPDPPQARRPAKRIRGQG